MKRTAETQFAYATVYGTVTIAADGKGVTRVAIGDTPFECPVAASTLTNKAATQIQEYFAGRRRSFDVALNPVGSAFQKAVWAELENVSYGQELTATDIAVRMGKPDACRSVGAAIRRNPVSIIIPSHRIALSGHTRASKLDRALLAFEQKHFNR